jgi:rhodanese-related sulfurtransferase
MARMSVPIGQAGGYSAIIDARTEDEFALDHLPGALNWPSLDNEQRREIGTLYKQVGSFEAKKKGAGLVAANIARHIEKHVMDLPKDWQPLVYCWRGGKRSGSLALVLGQIGFRVWLIEGGYKAFRAAMVQDIAKLVSHLKFQVITGPTGSGKTRLLHALATAGAQVLDLEDLAKHRSSVLGRIPGQPQPSQKHFDTLVWDTGFNGFEGAARRLAGALREAGAAALWARSRRWGYARVATASCCSGTGTSGSWAAWSGSCGSCACCLERLENLCPKITKTYAGSGKDKGGFANLIRFPTAWVFKAPEGLASELLGPLMCAGITTYSPLKRHGKPGAKVCEFDGF